MSSGTKFEIANINIVYGKQPFAFGTVQISRGDLISEDFDVAHNISAKVRISLPAEGTVEALQQAILEKAREQLGLVLADIEGKTALELSAATRERIELELAEASSS